MNREWDAQRACEFWPDQRGHWAPVGWKDHLNEFNVFYNGTVFAGIKGTPEEQKLTCELRVNVCAAPVKAKGCDKMLSRGQNPDGLETASWTKDSAPVYVIEHVFENAPVKVEQRQFAHIPGGRAVKRGDEPHFLWMRFVVTDTIPMINPVKNVACCLTLQGATLAASMSAFNNVNFNSKPATIIARDDCRLATPAKAEYLDRHLVLNLPCRVGAQVDAVFAIRPVDAATMRRELALGYDGALREANRFWKAELKTRTSIRVSEPLVQGWIDQLPRLEAMIGEKHPASGQYFLPSGSFFYEAIWPTPTAMAAYAMEFVGHGREVAKYIETYRQHQGTIKPPSPYLEKHPGYLATPASHTSIDWLTDHGAIMWMAANHGLFSMDARYLERWVPALVKGCEFVRDARRNQKHKGHPGILPAGIANDCSTTSQAAWNDAWTFKGLTTTVRLLERLRHRRAGEFRREAESYRGAFQRAYRDVVAKSKRWTAPDGTRVPFTPPTLAEAKGYEAAHAFHLDGGALALVFGELFPASDPVMQACLRWFREGPQHRFVRKFSSCWQVPALVNEMSTCEPCYSWNLFHSFELGDRERFAQGLYSVFAGGASRQNFVSCETREGVFGNVFSHGLALMLLRMSVLHEVGDELHLLKMAPAALLRDFEWKNVPTWFGEVSISGRYEAGVLHLDYRPPTRSKPKRTVLHLPGYCKVRVGTRLFTETSGAIALA